MSTLKVALKTENVDRFLKRMGELNTISLEDFIDTDLFEEAIALFNDTENIFDFVRGLGEQGFSDLKVGMVLIIIDAIVGGYGGLIMSGLDLSAEVTPRNPEGKK